MSVAVSVVHRPVLAVREHVVPEETGAGGGVAVGVDKPLDDGIVVSGLQVVEARLCVVVVSLNRIQVKTRQQIKRTLRFSK